MHNGLFSSYYNSTVIVTVLVPFAVWLARPRGSRSCGSRSAWHGSGPPRPAPVYAAVGTSKRNGWCDKSCWKTPSVYYACANSMVIILW